MRRFSFALFILGQVALFPLQSWAGERWALLIGNTDYELFQSLINPGPDVRSLAGELEALGFNVMTRENLTAEGMTETVEEFSLAADGAESVFFHYAGHGFQIDGINYLIPIDVHLKDDDELRLALSQRLLDGDGYDLSSVDDALDEIQRDNVRSGSLELDNIVDMLENLAPTRIIFLDACRDIPEFRKTTVAKSEPLMRQTGFAQFAGEAGTLIAYSTQPGNVASDGLGKNSPFVTSLIKHMSEPGLEIRELLTEVRREVRAATSDMQTPWDHSSLLEGFYFNPPRERPEDISTSAREPADPVVSDEELWASVKSLLDRDSYFRYLDAYPTGTHAEEARTLIRKLDQMHGEPGASDMRLASIGTAGARQAQVAQSRPPARVETPPDREPKTIRIAVVGHEDFVGDRLAFLNDNVMGLPEKLVNSITGALTGSAGIDVVERGNLRYVIDEQRFGNRLGQTYLERTFEEKFDIRANGGDRIYIPGQSLDDGQSIRYGAGVGAQAAFAEHLDLLRDFGDLGTSVGAKYVLFGRLEKIVIKLVNRKLPYTTRVKASEIAGARVRLRLVDVESATVVAAFSLESEIESAVFEASVQDAQSLMFEELGRDVARQVVDILNPPRIVGLEPVLVDRGGTHGIEVGDQFVIFREDKDVHDAQGRKLGVHRVQVARAEVVSVQQLFAQLSVIEGDPPLQYDIAILEEEIRGRDSPTGGNIGKGRGDQLLNPSADRAKGLPKLAVLPVEFSTTALRSGLMDEETADVANEPFGSSVTARLLSSRRFEFLDRFVLDRILDEQSMAAIQAGALPPDFAELEVADFLIVTKITLAEYVGSINASIPATSGEEELAPTTLQGVNTAPARGYVEGVVTVINVRNGTWSEAAQISVERNMQTMSKERALLELSKAFADQASIELTNAIFPMKVAHAQTDGTVYVNRGEDGGLGVGDVLTVFRPGVEIRDPDTGQVIGSSEEQIGQVQLARVERSSSTGSILSADQPIAAGDVLYRQQANRGRFSASPAADQDDTTGDSIALASPRADGLAVLALRRVDSSANGDFALPADDLSSQLKLDLTGRLIKSRRFSVVEREDLDTLIEEMKRNQAIAGAPGGGRVSPIDYVVMIRLNNLYIKPVREQVALVDRVDLVNLAVADAQIRLVDVRTSEQLTADSIRFERKLGKKIDTRRVAGELVSLLSQEIVKTVVNAVYPIKIVGGNEIDGWYVNRGSDGGVDTGLGFEVFRLGEELRDPDTGVSFGREERRVGSVRVAKVDPARSLVEAIEGGEFERGDLLRLMQAGSNGQGTTDGATNVIQPKW